MGKAQSSCASAIPILFDGVSRTYAAAGASVNSTLCQHTGPDNSTYFRFNSGATPCPTILIQTTPATETSVLLYKGNCANGSLIDANSMCLVDGDGTWSTDMAYIPLTPNTDYFIIVRVKGNFSGGTITITGSIGNTLGDNCASATTIGTTWVQGNNFCNTPGPNITANQVCGTTLENTRWHVATIDIAGPAVINIKNIECDAIFPGNHGYQIGFFTGSCTGLQSLFCQTQAADGDDFLQYTTPSYPAGTKIYIAIDGNAGANCKYEISGINVIGVLALNPIIPRTRTQPNPLFVVSNKTIHFNSTKPLNFQLYDMTKRLLTNKIVTNTNVSCPYPTGIYLMMLDNEPYKIFLH
jgi:hypothetical protein